MRLTKEQRLQVRISFNMLCDRQTGTLNGKNAVQLFAEYSKGQGFTIPLQPEFLMPLVSPYFNNLVNFVGPEL